jgi:hypothetical protein
MTRLRLGWVPRARAALVPLSLWAAIAGAGCTEVRLEPSPTPPGIGRLGQASVNKVDLLLAIDNSRSMADKQAILSLAVPDLVRGLVSPRCVDDFGVPAFTQPPGPLEACPAGTQREFEPVLDIHIGVISSSIGGHGSDACPDVDPNSKECAPAPNTTNNDKGHLLARLGQCGTQEVPTWNDKKFLVWDPTQSTHSPPGEAILDEAGNGLVPSLREMVVGAGQIGCGYESQLESWYRFLVESEPYETIEVIESKATPMGTDAVLLQQRAAFLRPDSLLAIVMLTDENDCSIKEYGQFYYVAQQNIGGGAMRMPRARQECTTKGPNDLCCRSCGQSDGECPPDPTCKDASGKVALSSPEEDDVNLRCWDQKRRFGIDFLYPTDRYVKALTSAKIEDRAGNLIDNPIFSDLDPGDDNTNIRGPGLVLMAGIVGVPWQDIARDKTDLGKGFKSAEELAQPIDATGVTPWNVILGNPEKDVKPLDPLMVEAIAKRTGTNPITGDVLVDASSPVSNPINGHERTIANDDLQYACIFDLLPGTERDCSDASQTACDCSDVLNDDPLCMPNPSNNDTPTLQSRAKAYPSLRALSVLRGIGPQGVVASVCPASVADPASADFGYRPAVDAILERAKPKLGASCLPRTLPVDSEGRAQCVLLEARKTNGQCNCDPTQARQPVQPANEPVRKAALTDPSAATAGWDCFCEMIQLEGYERTACQALTEDPPLLDGQPVVGWCYVDATAVPPLGNVELVDQCPENEKRRIRFAGVGEPVPGATVFISCAGE